MLFEVFNQYGKRVFYTASEKAIPTKEELIHRAEVCGYTYKLDGKAYKVPKKEKK